ncbi:hypothetical protein V3C99_001620, partial [Haemonchus contortus]
MWFLIEFLYNYVLILLFLEVWSVFLLIIHTLIAYSFFKRLPQYGSGFAHCVSLLMTSSLLFELVGLYNSVLYDNSPDSFQLSSRLFTSKVSRNLNWFGPLWKLNPASVVAQLAGKVLVSISGVCGRSVSAYQDIRYTLAYEDSHCRANGHNPAFPALPLADMALKHRKSYVCSDTLQAEGLRCPL